MVASRGPAGNVSRRPAAHASAMWGSTWTRGSLNASATEARLATSRAMANEVRTTFSSPGNDSTGAW